MSGAYGGYPINRFTPANYQTSSAVGGDAANPAAGEFTRPAEESVSSRANVINNICKGTLEPDVITTSPVPKNNPQVMKVQMKETTTLRVSAPYAGNPGSQASADSSTGLVLVDWKAGPSTGVYHMGILPNNATWSRTDTYDPGLNNLLTLSTEATLQTGITQLTLNKALALPYNKASGRQIRIVSTNLAQNFTKSRLYSARMSMVSDTVPLNAAIAAGNVTASVITETPGVSQNVAGDDCYSVSDIVNGSRWKPETVQAHSLMDGVTIVQGPDIVEELPPVDQINRNVTDGAWESVAAQVGWNTSKTALVTLTSPYASTCRPVCCFWLSPWNINAVQQNGQTLMGNQYNNGYFSAIPEMQMVSIRIRAPFWAIGAFTTATSYAAWVVVEHVFGALNANGQLVLGSIADTRLVGSGSLGSLSLGGAQAGSNFRSAALNAPMIDVTSDPRSEYVRRRNAGQDLGKYIGSQVTMYIQIFGSSGADPSFTLHIGGVDGYAPSDACENILEVCAVSLNTVLSGPMSVIRYDEVAVGQNIRITSTVNTDNLSKSALSVITPSDMYDTCYDINIYQLLNSLYFGPHTDFRCVWTNSNYRKVLAKMGNWELSDFINTISQSPRTMQLAEAAGVFDGLKSLGKHVLGLGKRLIRHPMVRQRLNDAIDSGTNMLQSKAKEMVQQFGDSGGHARGYFGDSNWDD